MAVNESSGHERYPSSIAESYRSTSPPQVEDKQSQSMWTKVKNSIVNTALVAVGLEPTEDEALHWDAIKGVMLGELTNDETDQTAPSQLTMQASHHPRDRSLLRHMSGYDFGRTETDGGRLFKSRLISVPSKRSRQMSVQSYRADKGTGRNQAMRVELKPDLWKLLFNSIQNVTKSVGFPVEDESSEVKSSFFFEEGEEEEEEKDSTDYGIPGSPTSGRILPTVLEQEEEHFFDNELEQTDSAFVEPAPSVVRVRADPAIPKPDVIRRDRIKGVKSFVKKVTFTGGYGSGSGGLGAVTKLLHFDYINLRPGIQKELDNQLLHNRPYFTYWLMMVHLIIMVIALSVYGFAPYGWDLKEERDIVRQTDLSFAAVAKMVVPSVWLGPPQQALVLLGALFAPCMRRDRQLFDGIERDNLRESTSSGCCVRRDGSGCFQAEDRGVCQPRFSNFVFNTNTTTEVRAVCGTSPLSCLDPSPNFFPNAWDPTDILTWPICRMDINMNFSEPHLSCEVTSRPCCYGIQAICIITTREQCDFLEGRFHQDAFLCSQVDCLNDICGLLPFGNFNQPDQVYRLWIALFLHAGLIHLVLSLVFSFFVLRYIEKRLGWLRTATLYVLSGIGGNLVSAYFAPYNPEVGPAGSILGVVAYFFVFLIFESRLLKHPLFELLKLLCVCVFLLLLGLIPYVDNYAHIGGLVFGFLIAGIIIPYGAYKEVWRLTKRNEADDRKWLIAKLVMVSVGLPTVVLLYVLFFLLLYVVQDTWEGFSYFTCIPFTSTLCIDQQVLIRDRTEFII